MFQSRSGGFKFVMSPTHDVENFRFEIFGVNQMFYSSRIQLLKSNKVYQLHRHKFSCFSVAKYDFDNQSYWFFECATKCQR